MWTHVIGPGDGSDPELTRSVLDTALARLGRPTLDGQYGSAPVPPGC